MSNNEFDYEALPVLSDYHTHPAKFKWLRGGVGGSKSYSLQHQALMMADWFPGSVEVLGRKVEHILEKTTMRETVELAHKYKIYKNLEKTKKILHLINGSIIMFYPMNLPITEYGSINANWIGLDEASEIPERIIKYMFTRLRRPTTIYNEKVKQELNFASTWEGHNHLWKIFFRDNIHDPQFKTWKVRTCENPYLPDDYEQTLRKIHSEEWCRRYLDCEETSFAGLVYDELDPEFHNIPSLPTNFDYKRARKCISIDTGLVHPSAIVVGVLDEKRDCIYILDEFNRSGVGVMQLAKIITQFMQRYGVQRNEVIIDPAASSKEQTSGTSVRKELKRYLGFYPKYANKNKRVGIERIKRRLTIRENDKTHEKYANMYFIRGKAKDLIIQALEYVWVDTTLEEFEIYAKEEPKKQKDDLMDAWRYLVMELDDYALQRQRFLEDGYDPKLKLPYYQNIIKRVGATAYMPKSYHKHLKNRC